MGLSYLVYPGAHHTRFHHAIGSMHLMKQAIQVLRFKKVDISDDEEIGLLCAILLHDIGHGPFSHAMEHSIVEGLNHERISGFFMEELNAKFNGSLTLGIAILKGTHPRKFLNQLVSSQLDMDRLDYLKRDSFYTGVAEGNINAERLITMLTVHNDELVVEEKGIYSVEKFLMARRFMYWQVYLHKTGLVAEQLLIRTLKRAKELHSGEIHLACSAPLQFFIENKITRENFSEDILKLFAQLDDVDILSAIKKWQFHSDFVLSKLCQMILNRHLLKIKIKNKPIASEKINQQLEHFKTKHNVSEHEAGYFIFTGSIANKAYDQDYQNINILKGNGKIVDVARASDHLNLAALTKTVEKFYMCFPEDNMVE